MALLQESDLLAEVTPPGHRGDASRGLPNLGGGRVVLVVVHDLFCRAWLGYSGIALGHEHAGMELQLPA